MWSLLKAFYWLHIDWNAAYTAVGYKHVNRGKLRSVGWKKSVKVFVTIGCSKPLFQDCLKAGRAYYALLQRNLRNRNGGMNEEEEEEEKEKGEEAKEEERRRE